MNVRDKIPVCPHGTREDIDFYLVSFCDSLVNTMDEEITFSSGYRCKECNEEVGGAVNSAHLFGKAVDIAPIDSYQRYKIVAFATTKGVRRIGIAKDHIHLDLDESKKQQIMWLE